MFQWYQSVPAQSLSVTGASKDQSSYNVCVLSNPDLASKDDSTTRLAYRWREVM
jgi:hypothetical protein